MADFIKEGITAALKNSKEFLEGYTVESRKEAIEDYYWCWACGFSLEKILDDTQLEGQSNYMKDIGKYAMRYPKEQQVNVLREKIDIAQYAEVLKDWNKTKQTYCFDPDFVTEMMKTDSVIKTFSKFLEKLPFKTMYLDYSKSTDLIEKTGADGILVDIFNISENNNDLVWVIQRFLFKDQRFLGCETNCMLDTKDAERDFISVEEEIFKNGDGEGYRSLFLLQSLLYLCSYEPDIRDDSASKQAYKKVKQAIRKGSKQELPTQKHEVGERFGEAFRKWTEGSLGKGSSTTGSGKRVRPHVRRAHWHRYWVGKKGQQELIVKWVHECFCNCSEETSEENLDIVKHKA